MKHTIKYHEQEAVKEFVSFLRADLFDAYPFGVLNYEQINDLLEVTLANYLNDETAQEDGSRSEATDGNALGRVGIPAHDSTEF